MQRLQSNVQQATHGRHACNASTGECAFAPIQNCNVNCGGGAGGQTCSGNNSCTTNGACSNGNCAPTINRTCSAEQSESLTPPPGQRTMACSTGGGRFSAAPDPESAFWACVQGVATVDRPLTWGAGWRMPERARVAAASLDYCWRFFVGTADAQRCAEKLVAILEAEGLPYAIIGALALNEYGHRRVTVGVDLIMREADLQTFKRKYLGHGYAERVVGTGKLVDTEFNVPIDVLSSGRFPGDDKPKPIAFPDPAVAAIRGAPFAMLPITRWIELKLASGMVAPHRGKDLVDVQELIRSARLPRSLADDVHPWARDRFVQLWELAQVEDPF